jgi:hypothetical protein
MGTARTTPVIVAQPVPVVTASLPVVRAYRETMTLVRRATGCLEPGWLYFCAIHIRGAKRDHGEITRASALTVLAAQHGRQWVQSEF